MKIVKLACVGLFALVVAAACGGKSSQSGGSNTNWFSTCSKTADCGSGLECWCGICTSTCATECTSAPAAATCATPPGTCTQPTEKHACAIACTGDDDCTNLGTGARCVGSICRKESVRGSAKVSCDETSTEAYNRVQALVESADRSCKSIADCIEFPNVSCRNGCSIGVVSRAGAAAVQGGLDAIEDEVCRPFAASGCTVTEPPCVFPGEPTCVSGKCEHVLPGQDMGSGSDAGPPLSCQQLEARITTDVLRALQRPDRACKTSADCTVTMVVNQCLDGCTYNATSKSGAQTLRNDLDALERQYCGDFSAAGCTADRTPCVSPPTATCQLGQCELP